ncbi:MAG: HD-GYP domain-containing protein [Oligoflexales bacterium]
MTDNAKKFVIKEATRKRCKIIPADEKTLKRFIPICLELFPYLKEVEKIDFSLFFRNGDEIIEFIKPNELSTELLEQMWAASLKPAALVEICLYRSDYKKFEAMIDSVRSKKIKAVLEMDRTLDPKVTEVYSTLSSASQMIVRGGITNHVANQAIAATATLMSTQIDSEVAVGTLSRMINCDSSLYDHSASVAMLSAIIASSFLPNPLHKQECEVVAQCGLYHDAGKSCVPNHVLNKPGIFTPEEFEIMKFHTQHGYDELIKAIGKGAPIHDVSARVALEHHERFTGKGYPNQRKGRLEDDENGIHQYTRIVSIADVYSALLMKRVYKDALTSAEAIKLMKKVAENDFDPLIFDPFYNHVMSSIDLFDKKEEAINENFGSVRMIGKSESFSKALKEAQDKNKVS